MMKLEISEAQKRYNRLDTLRVMMEGYDEGTTGHNICMKAWRAENKPTREFTGIIRLTAEEKDFLSYKLEDQFLDEEDIEVIKFYTGIE